MKHRGLEPIAAARLTEALARTPKDHYVVWTGHACVGQPGSLRARALACVQEVATPVPLRTVLQRAAQIEAAGGLDPDSVRNAVRMHQLARPAVCLLVERLAGGDYVAVTDIPTPAGLRGRIGAGEIVIDARTGPRFAPLSAALTRAG
jgi:hypothetical protein